MRTLTKLVCAVLLVMQLHGIAYAAPAPEAAGQKTNMFYVVAAHPDDEPNIWSLITTLDPTTYVVFVNLTRGEGTVSCATAGQSKNDPYMTEELTFVEGFEATGPQPATGPYKYQGPDSPEGVDEDNLGETHPYGFPWTGQGSEECKRARVASWHWFMDDMHGLDGSGTSFEIGTDPWLDDDYQGDLCAPGGRGQGEAGPFEKELGCADVWADDQGARISFDLGNAETITHPDGTWSYKDPLFSTEHVISALELVRNSRTKWGLPVLPEIGMASASGFYDADDCGPAKDDNPDHKAVQDALLNHDFGAGPQYQGVVCPHDRSGGLPAEARVLRPDLLVEMQLVDPVTEERLGPFNKHYGWLFSTYMYFKSTETYFKAFD